MKRLLMSSAAACAALIATPAFAQDAAPSADLTGARAAIVISSGGPSATSFQGETIGFDVGHDWDLGGAVAGVAVQYDTDLGSDMFDASQTAVIGRVGSRISGSNSIIYLGGGYTRVSLGATPFDTGGDGIRGLFGAEIAVGANVAFKLEQRYSNYEAGVELHQTVAGINFRF